MFNMRRLLFLLMASSFVLVYIYAVNANDRNSVKSAEDEPKELKLKPVEGEPTAIGLPCIVTESDIDRIKKAEPKAKSLGTKPAATVRSRTLRGCGLVVKDNFVYWFSDGTSTAYCATTNFWKSGHVIWVNEVGTCASGVRFWDIVVSD